MKPIPSLLLLALAVISFATAVAAAPGAPLQPEPEAIELTDVEVRQLAAAALQVRRGLAEISALRAEPQNRERRLELQRQIDDGLRVFLDVARLSRDDFVRLLDSDGGIDPPQQGPDDGAQIRPLAPRDR